MRDPFRRVAILLLLLARAAVAEAADPPAAPGSAAAPPAPTISPADKALSQEGLDLSDAILLQRGRITRLQAQAQAGAYRERLDALAKDPARGAAATAAKDRIIDAWNRSSEEVLKWRAVDATRGCRYDLLNFDSALVDDDPGRREATLPEARTRLGVCVARARPIVADLTGAADALDAALRDADRLLSPPPAGPKAP
jgi:hypothetical protein